jgi:DNA polymerase-3 subunit epsilon
LLQELAKQFEIDQRFCKYGAFQMAKLHYKLTTKIYQIVTIIMIRSQAAIDFYLNSRPSFAIIDKGRTNDERSYIWVENGRFYGMGYIDSEVIIGDLSQIKEHIMPYKTNQYIMQINFPLHRSTKVHLSL